MDDVDKVTDFNLYFDVDEHISNKSSNENEIDFALSTSSNSNYSFFKIKRHKTTNSIVQDHSSSLYWKIRRIRC